MGGSGMPGGPMSSPSTSTAPSGPSITSSITPQEAQLMLGMGSSGATGLAGLDNSGLQNMLNLYSSTPGSNVGSPTNDQSLAQALYQNSLFGGPLSNNLSPGQMGALYQLAGAGGYNGSATPSSVQPYWQTGGGAGFNPNATAPTAQTYGGPSGGGNITWGSGQNGAAGGMLGSPPPGGGMPMTGTPGGFNPFQTQQPMQAYPGVGMTPPMGANYGQSGGGGGGGGY